MSSSPFPILIIGNETRRLWLYDPPNRGVQSHQERQEVLEPIQEGQVYRLHDDGVLEGQGAHTKGEWHPTSIQEVPALDILIRISRMEFDKDEKYTIGQREFLLLVKSELEDLRKKIGGPITHHDTEDLLIHRIVERVVLWNQSMKTYTKFVVSEPSYKKPTPIESLTIKDIIKKDKKVFEGKKNASTVAKEYPEFESFLELLKKHHAIVGVKAATNRVLFCISWLIETIMKDNHVGKLPPFLEKVIHHASAAPAASSSSSSSSSSAASPSKSSKTSKMPNGPSPKKGVRIQGGSKNRGSKNRGSKNRGSKNRGTRRSRR